MAAKLLHLFRVCDLQDDETKEKSTFLQVSNQYGFVVFLGDDCFYFGELQKFLDLPVLEEEPEEAPDDTAELPFLKRIEVDQIKSIHLSPCEEFLAVVSETEVLLYSLASISKDVSNPFIPLFVMFINCFY